MTEHEAQTAREDRIIQAWHEARGYGFPAMMAITEALTMAGITERRERDAILDSRLFDGWSPEPTREARTRP